MGWRRSILESFVWACALVAPKAHRRPDLPARIFVLRNNDIGDLLIVTPLFEALKRTFPDAEIMAGIGSWNTGVLLGNPYVDRVVPINGPWHNHFVQPQTVLRAVGFAFFSDEAKVLQDLNADVGIDVLGSGFGSLLMIRAGIPYRLGVRGYAGGDSVVQSAVDYNPNTHVGRQALNFAQILGCSDLPENRPQIFLEERIQPHRAVVFAPGSGDAKKAWPGDHFVKLSGLLRDQKLFVIGSQSELGLAEKISRNHGAARNLTGRLTLRESFGVVGGAKLVVSNSSMAMHVAAAFRRPCATLLGEAVSSASQHHRQWGYPETLMLGRDVNRPEIFNPQEAADKIRALLAEVS